MPALAGAGVNAEKTISGGAGSFRLRLLCGGVVLCGNYSNLYTTDVHYISYAQVVPVLVAHPDPLFGCDQIDRVPTKGTNLQ